MAYRYVFGPVFSGRLGLSLGLDLLGSKTCSMDCVYCEVGATDELTVLRRPYVPAADILAELEAGVAEGHETEYVTLGGSGEPCLNSEMGAVIAGIRRILPGKRVAVLTNATHLTDPAVREELQGADVVLPSLDSLVPEEFRRINRAAKTVNPLDIAEGLLTFRQEYTGKIFLEVLLAAGYNDSRENLERLREFVSRLRPDRVDVTTLSRPGTLAEAKAVDADTLAAWRRELGAGAQEQHRKAEAKDADPENAAQMILASLARRPQTVLQLAAGLGLTETSVMAGLKRLEGPRLAVTRDGENEYYALDKRA